MPKCIDSKTGALHSAFQRCRVGDTSRNISSGPDSIYLLSSSSTVQDYGSVSVSATTMSKQLSENPLIEKSLDVIVNALPEVNSEDSYRGDGQAQDRLPISSIDKREPIVTRKELWSYYRKSAFSPYVFFIPVSVINVLFPQSTIMVTM